MTPLLPASIEAVTANVVNATLEGVVIAGLVWLALRVSGRHNSRTRFAIWFLALLSIAILPFLANYHGSQPTAHVVTMPANWAMYLATAWALGFTIALARLVIGMFHLFSLRRHSEEINLQTLPASVALRLNEEGRARSVKLYRSSRVSIPAVIGFFRPAIILPTALVPELSEAELDVVLLHELAHLRRWDDWSNLAQKIVKAVFFFHPAVWWIENRLTIEREMACDEIVLARTANPRAYAAFLISFHEKLQRTRTMALVQALVSRVCQLSLRVAAILNHAKANAGGSRRMPVLGVALALVAMLFSAVPRVPEFVSFGSPPHAQVASAPPASERAALSVGAPSLSAGQGGPTMQHPLANDLSNAQVVPAAYHPPVPSIRRTVAKKPHTVRANTANLATPRMLIVVRTARFDGSAWTICVWSLDPATNSTTQSTWVVKL